MNKITFRKRLFALAVCVFAWVGVNAQSIDTSDPSVLIFGPNDVAKDFSSFPANVQTALTNGTITTIKLATGSYTGWTQGWLTNGGSNDGKNSITTIDLTDATFNVTATNNGPDGNANITVSPQGWSFKNFGAVRTINWPSNKSMTVLPENAFYACGIENLTLPSSLKYICGFAFSTCANLKRVVFPEDMTSLYIKNKAFAQTISITDVYVLCDADLRAEYESFDFTTTNNQTQVEGMAATLHFPSSHTENYANLGHPLTAREANDAGLFQKWLSDHRNAARNSAQGAGNGWHEFINAGSLPPDQPVETGEVILRTYSNLEYDHLTPKGFKAYIVTDIQGKNLILKSIPVIPRRTGVILYGQSNAKTLDGHNTFSLTTVNYTGHPITRENYLAGADDYTDDNTGERVKNTLMNYLVPTCFGTYKYKDKQGVEHTETVQQQVVGPYDVNDVNHPTAVTFRNFSLAKYSSTTSGKGTSDANNYRGFFRLKLTNNVGVTMPNDKAYLKLSATEYPDYMGGECIVIKDAYYTKVYENKQDNPALIEEHVDGKDDYWTKAIWENPVTTNNWGVRSGSTTAKYMGEPIFESVIEEKENGIATLIMPDGWLDSEMDSNNYYTLQGVKVTHPKKGIYIKDGKKIVVK
jgi:hypothetical protein